MAIRVTREPAGPPPYERCCFCRTPTSFWYTPKDVPCCPTCAKTHKVDDVPTKLVWWRRETALANETQCRRGACQADLGEHYGVHTTTHDKYCLGCMRRINRDCNQQIIVFPEDLPKDPT